MNEVEAIKYLKAMLPEKVSYCEMLGASTCYGDIMTYTDPEPYAIEAAIEALEKQVGKKATDFVVEEQVKIGNIKFGRGAKTYRCGMCKTPIGRHYTYCHKCGNLIDWSEEE